MSTLQHGRTANNCVYGRGQLVVTVEDDGVGLPTDFTADAADRLGMQIVRTLVSAELNGTVEFRPREDGSGVAGTRAVLTMPTGRRPRVGG